MSSVNRSHTKKVKKYPNSVPPSLSLTHYSYISMHVSLVVNNKWTKRDSKGRKVDWELKRDDSSSWNWKKYLILIISVLLTWILFIVNERIFFTCYGSSTSWTNIVSQLSLRICRHHHHHENFSFCYQTQKMIDINCVFFKIKTNVRKQ